MNSARFSGPANFAKAFLEFRKLRKRYLKPIDYLIESKGYLLWSPNCIEDAAHIPEVNRIGGNGYMTKRYSTLALLALGIMVLAFTPQAYAAATMDLCLTDTGTCSGGGDWVNFTSDGTTISGTASGTASGTGTLLGNNEISFTGTVGNANVTVDAGTTNAPGGTPTGQLSDLSYNDKYTGTSAETFTLIWSSLNFSPKSGFSLNGGGSLAAGSTVTTDACFSTANTLATSPCPLPANIGTLGPFSSTPYSGTVTTGATVSSTFEITQDVKLTFPAGTALQDTGDFSIDSSVPEPATVSLLGGILLLTVGVIRRRVQRT